MQTRRSRSFLDAGTAAAPGCERDWRTDRAGRARIGRVSRAAHCCEAHAHPLPPRPVPSRLTMRRCWHRRWRRCSLRRKRSGTDLLTHSIFVNLFLPLARCVPNESPRAQREHDGRVAGSGSREGKAQMGRAGVWRVLCCWGSWSM